MLDFVGIGAQKCGTTWVHYQLSKHPQIFFPTQKEVHFWDENYHKGIKWYKSLFSSRRSRYKAKLTRWVSKLVTGEITPAYAFLPVEKIQEMYMHFPYLRLFYILRDPIDRAWSSSLMALRYSHMTIDEASDQWFIDHFKSQGSLMRGDYETCIKNWQTIYPPEQLLILDYREISQSPTEMMQKISSHIGIDPKFYTEKASPDDLSKRIHTSSGEPIRESLRPVLEELYREKQQQYYNLFERSL